MESLIKKSIKESGFPLTYRAKDVKYFFEKIRDSQSSFLIAIPGVGKSVFLRFITYNEGAKKKYLGKNYEKTVIVLVDLNELLELSPIEFYKLFLKRTLERFLEKKPLKNLESEAKTTFKKGFEAKDGISLFESIKKLVDIVCNKAGFKLVVIIDRIHKCWQEFDESFFNTLKALRDSAKESFCYLFASTFHPVEDSALEKVAPIIVLVTPNIYYLRPCDKKASLQVIAEIIKGRGFNLSKDQKEAIYNLTGGHPSLIKFSIQFLQEHLKNSSFSDVLDDIYTDSSIQLYLQQIWSFMRKVEQEALLESILTEKLFLLDSPPLRSLALKGILKKEREDKYRIFSSLLEDFVIKKSEGLSNAIGDLKKIPKGIWFDETTREIYKEGKRLRENLTKQEYQLFYFFWKNADRICIRDEIAEGVWGEEAMEGVSDEAIDQLVSRLRKKIENDPNIPLFIKTIRGRGYQFRPKPS